MLIGALAAATGVTTKTLRFYETAGLLADPGRTGGGYRDYPPTAVARVAFVRRAQAAGLTLAQIREVLAVRDRGEAPCDHVASLIDDRLAEVDRRLAELRTVREELCGVRERLASLDRTACSEDEVCAAIPRR